MLPYMRPQNTWQSELIDKPRLYQLALDAITRADSAEQGGECFSLFCRGQWLLTGLQEVICQENLLMDFFRGFQQIANAAEVINVILVTELKASVVASKEVIWSYDKVAFIAIIGNQQELEFIPDMLLMSCYSPTVFYIPIGLCLPLTTAPALTLTHVASMEQGGGLAGRQMLLWR